MAIVHVHTLQIGTMRINIQLKPCVGVEKAERICSQWKTDRERICDAELFLTQTDLIYF